MIETAPFASQVVTQYMFYAMRLNFGKSAYLVETVSGLWPHLVNHKVRCCHLMTTMLYLAAKWRRQARHCRPVTALRG